MTVQVVIAHRDLGCPHRQASLEFVARYYSDHGYPVLIQSGDDTFTRANGINAGIRNTDADIIVQSDPDSFVPIGQLEQAIELAAASDGHVAPFTRYLYLNQCRTRATLDGFPPDQLGPDDCDNHGFGGVGNVAVFSRRTWETCGGYDERFGLWGGDDAAFAYAAAAFTQPLRRVDGDVYHLWHPRHPDSDPETRAYVDQFVIVAEYRDATAAGNEAVRDYVRNR